MGHRRPRGGRATGAAGNLYHRPHHRAGQRAALLQGVSFNTNIDNAASESFSNTGVAQMPYAVADFHHEDQAGDAVFTWLRRSRFSPPQAFRETELAESLERYEIEIEIEKASVVIQTAQVSAASYTYSAADQAADGVISGDALTVRAWQVSAAVGRGYVSALPLVA